MDGMTQLRKGSIATFHIPPSLGYKSEEKPKIPAFSHLRFDIEVIDVKDPDYDPDFDLSKIVKETMDDARAKAEAEAD